MMRGFLIVLSVLCGIIGLFWLPGWLGAVVFAVWAMLCEKENVELKDSQHSRDLWRTMDHEKGDEIKELRQRIADLESQAAAKGTDTHSIGKSEW